MRKYPVIKCNEKLWEEIKEQLDIWGVSYFSISYYWKQLPYLVSNYGGPSSSRFEIGNTSYSDDTEIEKGYRYLVKTKEEFLSAIARLLNKEYKMEERNVKVSLEKAREWYKSDGTLKEIALQAFTKDELEELPTLEEIFDKVVKNTPSLMVVPTKETPKWAIMHNLAIIAEYLNDGWKPNWSDPRERKYCIYKENAKIRISSVFSTQCAITYFKTKELAEKAIKILGEEIEYMFD
jgi:hypothetical protein|nr:MAG TPA: hypothetical protein [Bacteriophage sp.]